MTVTVTDPYKETAIVGMSPGNSYFTRQNINCLFQKVLCTYRCITVMIPDIPAIETYKALGYSHKRATEKAITKGGNHLRSKLRQVLGHLSDEGRVNVLNWTNDIASHTSYRHVHQQMRALYDNCADFRKDARETTAQILNNSNRVLTELDASIDMAVVYLLSEIAFLAASPAMLGVDRLDYIYHQPWPVFEQFIAGQYDGKPRSALNFVIVQI